MASFGSETYSGKFQVLSNLSLKPDKDSKWVICDCVEPTDGCGYVSVKKYCEIDQGLNSSGSGSIKFFFHKVLCSFYTLKALGFKRIKQGLSGKTKVLICV